MRKGYIYGARCTCHPEDGTRYVGQTVISVSSRKHVHLWNSRTLTSKSYNSHFSNWIRKHGEENVEFFVLEETTEEKIDQREDFWITQLRSQGNRLTNIKGGGGQARGHKRPEYVNMRGENNPMYGKDRRELMAYARSFQGPMSDEEKARRSEAYTGSGNPRAIVTEDQVREIRQNYTGKYGELTATAKKYGLTVGSIYGIVNRKSWKHVD